MNESDTGQQAGGIGRRISVLAYGDNADEIELSALDQARRFFGDDMRLEVVRDYAVSDAVRVGTLAVQAGGKAFVASITVREPV